VADKPIRWTGRPARRLTEQVPAPGQQSRTHAPHRRRQRGPPPNNWAGSNFTLIGIASSDSLGAELSSRFLRTGRTAARLISALPPSAGLRRAPKANFPGPSDLDLESNILGYHVSVATRQASESAPAKLGRLLLIERTVLGRG
jgi:hypothetical protein